MKTRMLAVALLVGALTLGFTTQASAHPWGCGRGHWGGPRVGVSIGVPVPPVVVGGGYYDGCAPAPYYSGGYYAPAPYYGGGYYAPEYRGYYRPRAYAYGGGWGHGYYRGGGYGPRGGGYARGGGYEHGGGYAHGGGYGHGGGRGGWGHR